MSSVRERSSVLVIDDQRFQRRTLARMLEGLGVQTVHEAADGTSALNLVREHRDSLLFVVSDVDMPEMDGLEFMRCLAKEAPQMAVAIHSALDRTLLKSVEVMAAEYGLRLVGVLEKPVSQAMLVVVMDNARKSALRPQRTQPEVNAGQVTKGLNNDEFEPWFQPKIDLRTGRPCGAEALVRWCRPQIEPLAPDRFLAVVSASGLMRAMTLSLATRCAQSLELLGRRGSGLTLSLNVCPSLLDDPGFGDALARALVDAGAGPEEVILEVTESAAARNQGAALENLARLRMRGFQLSIDDFGTGFSSLSQLVRTPFSELKIDRSFVSRIEIEGADRMLVDSTVALAHRLGLRTVAEGIEDPPVLRWLREAGCEFGQGFLFSRGLEAEEFERWLAEWPSKRGAIDAAASA